MKDLEFKEVADRNVAIVDATTVVDLCSAHIFEALTRPIDDKFSALELDGILRVVCTSKAALHKTWSNDLSLPYWNIAAFAAALNILERMCVHDYLLVDGNALHSLSDTPGFALGRMEVFSKVLHTVSIPRDVYGHVAKVIQDYLASLQRSDIPSALSKTFSDFQAAVRSESVLDRGADKPYQDFLSGRLLTGACPALADSGHTAPRTLFYLELSRLAGCPVFLSHQKWEVFPYLREHLQNDIFKAIECVFESRLVQEAKKNLKKHFGLCIPVPGPPLLRLIVDNARSRGLSLLESALEIRSRRNAQHFRNTIFHLQKYVIRGGASVVHLNRELSKLEKIAARWGEKGIGFGTQVETRTIQLEAIPAIGWLLRLMSLGKIDVKLPRFGWSPKYLTFISSWYRL
jgi:hypothetical protein